MRYFPIYLLLFSPVLASAQGPVRFEKITLTDRYYCDGIATGDVNGDGRADVLSASKLDAFWFLNKQPEAAAK